GFPRESRLGATSAQHGHGSCRVHDVLHCALAFEIETIEFLHHGAGHPVGSSRLRRGYYLAGKISDPVNPISFDSHKVDHLSSGDCAQILAWHTAQVADRECIPAPYTNVVVAHVK